MTTAAITARGTARTSKDSSALTFYRRIFSDTPERSIRVRIVALMASVWAALTLVLVGASFAVPIISIPVFAIGHIVAYRAINRRIPALPVIIALVIIVVGVAMRHELVLAVRGERIPVAHFLLIAGSASVFEARTRAGLYTQILFSALIMFFASELAFGNEFAALLGGYLAIIVTFLALSQYTDITRDAVVKHRGGAIGATGFWAGVTALVAACTLIAFLLLPWDSSQAPESARFAILPHSGTGEGTEPALTPEEARELLEQAALRQQGGGAGDQLGGFPGTGGLTGSGGFGDGFSSGGITQSGQGSTVIPRSAGTALAAPEFDPGTVAYIRSGVASYWRSGVYDSFAAPSEESAAAWLSTLPDRRRLGSLFARPDGEEDERYLQTIFLEQGLGPAFITGYEPLSIAIDRNRFGLPSAEAGSTYQVVSGRPAITPDELREDTGGYASSEYSILTPGYEDVYALARAITAGAENDFDRASIIAGYLNGLEYDPESTSPLESSAELSEFVFGERPGSAIDFATAQALMSRAVGLQSRVATGFLPGSYNPYSGAAEIRDTDLHAWAEVLFDEAGWVPFDASSRPDLPNPDAIENPPPGGLSSLLDRRLGDNLASALQSSPGGLSGLFEWLLKAGPGFGASIMLLTAIAGFAYWWYWIRRRQQRETAGPGLMSYSALAGPDRSERMKVLKAFSRLERRIAKSGFRRRRGNESFSEYAERAAGYMTRGADDLLLAAMATERAAYSPRPLDADEAHRAERSMKSAKFKLATE